VRSTCLTHSDWPLLVGVACVVPACADHCNSSHLAQSLSRASHGVSPRSHHCHSCSSSGAVELLLNCKLQGHLDSMQFVILLDDVPLSKHLTISFDKSLRPPRVSSVSAPLTFVAHSVVVHMRALLPFLREGAAATQLLVLVRFFAQARRR
jgi:hypothetical protein